MITFIFTLITIMLIVIILLLISLIKQVKGSTVATCNTLNDILTGIAQTKKRISEDNATINGNFLRMYESYEVLIKNIAQGNSEILKNHVAIHAKLDNMIRLNKAKNSYNGEKRKRVNRLDDKSKK